MGSTGGAFDVPNYQVKSSSRAGQNRGSARRVGPSRFLRAKNDPFDNRLAAVERVVEPGVVSGIQRVELTILDYRSDVSFTQSVRVFFPIEPMTGSHRLQPLEVSAEHLLPDGGDVEQISRKLTRRGRLGRRKRGAS